MIPRKTNTGSGRVSPLLLILLALGFFLATYNVITLLTRSRSNRVGSEWSDDPVLEQGTGGGGGEGGRRRRFHVAMTATDAPYSKWQCRIMYYWYRKMAGRVGSDMGGFTRVLHSGKPDNLMDEIPTFVVDPLPDGLDRGYIVLNRPWAFVQWLEKATIEEEPLWRKLLLRG